MTMGMGVMDLGTLMSQMNGDVEAKEEEIKNRFSAEQARGMLRDALALLDVKHNFERGQILRPKRGLYDGRRGSCGGVLMFLSYDLPKCDLEPYDNGRPVGLSDADCVCGEILPSGAMAEYLMCSRYLEPDPEAVA